MSLLEIEGLSACAGARMLLDDVTLSLRPGRVLAVMGSSGAGKTTLGLAALGQALPGIRLSGAVRLDGTELLGLTAPELRRARAGVVGHLPQHPGAVLDPARRCGPVLAELAALRHRGRGARQAAARAALRAAGLDDIHWRRFPHQLSGGQQQRMALATTLVTRPRLLVLDEPTTGLDPQAREALAERLRTLAADGTALLVLTHDLALVRATADDVAVLDQGTIATRRPQAAPPVEAEPVVVAEQRPELLTVRGLTVRVRDAVLLHDIDLDVPAGGRTALIGPSGAGKSTLARALAGLVRPAAGTIEFEGAPLPALRRRSVTQLRTVQYVHQDARASFDEFRPVLGQVAATGTRLRGLPKTTALARARELLCALELDAADRPPAQLSGGQLRRCALARAMLAEPRLLICDEGTAGLDTATRTRVLHVLAEFAATTGAALLMIGHDHSALSTVTDRTLVLDGGRWKPLDARNSPGSPDDLVW